ncbi:MAG: hypothetical protein LBV23_01840 [Deltaproteobacteria bacterium]|jgi:hypothetical protein|nr:hypothetical protein [Deltaproteobacteria bacterium]
MHMALLVLSFDSLGLRVSVHQYERLRARSQEQRCGAKPIEREDTYRNNVAPYRA